MTQFLLVALLLAITWPGHVLSQQHTQACTLSTRPCRLRVTAYTHTGQLVGSSSTPTCSCSQRQGACSNNWSDRKVISRNLLSGNYNMTFQMMFCGPFNIRQCNIGETALVVSSSLVLPTNLVAHSCQCAVALPLMLKRSWRGLDYLHYHSYVCNNEMPVCSGVNAECANIEEEDVTYRCRCPTGMTCRSNAEDEPYAPFHTGYCTL